MVIHLCGAAKASEGGLCACTARVRDEGVAGTVGVKESIELPDLGA